MKLIYSTNICSHHQLPVATELAKLLGPEQYKMAIFEDVHDERRAMGWAENHKFPWMIGPPRTPTDMQRLMQECLDADVMVIGAGPQKVMEARIATGKQSLVASERLLKKPFHRLRMLNPRYATGIRRYRSLVNYPHVHALAIGHYAPDDLFMIDSFADRIWKWGYFIDTPVHLPAPPSNRPLKILWAGRMLKWKRVDLLLKAISKLLDSGYISECLIVGDGPERKRLLNLARKLDLIPGLVRFSPSVSFTEVRRLMRKADVCVLTSNRHEGWGAVAGEAMVEGCVLVANENAGASQDLVQNGLTGLLFRDGDVAQLAEQLKQLATDYLLRKQLRQRAWKQMQNLWHPRVGAERLVALCNGLLSNRELPTFKTGPCSRYVANLTREK